MTDDKKEFPGGFMATPLRFIDNLAAELRHAHLLLNVHMEHKDAKGCIKDLNEIESIAAYLLDNVSHLRQLLGVGTEFDDDTMYIINTYMKGSGVCMRKAVEETIEDEDMND